jgi:hypothetical protein
MSSSIIYFYDKISKKNVSFSLSDELKAKILDSAGNFFPYPIIISHDGHYTILHMDQDFKDRGTVQTKIFIELEKYAKSTSETKKEILGSMETQKENLFDIEKIISVIKEKVVCELKEDVLNKLVSNLKADLQEEMKEQIQIELSAASLNAADIVVKELKEPGSVKKTRKRSSKKTAESSDSNEISKENIQEENSEQPKLKSLTLDQISGFGLEGINHTSDNPKKEEEK